MDKEIVIGFLGVIGAMSGIYFGYSGFKRNERKDVSHEGAKDGALFSDIGYIKSGIDDLKRKQEKSEERHIEIIGRLTSVEVSAHLAHKRIDELTNSEVRSEVMNLTTKYMTRNDCYTANRKITPKGIMVHSTATPGVMAADWFSRWDKSFKVGEINTQACVHAFLDDKGVYQYLPWNHRAWHCGGSGNDTHISFEICEPAGFTYSGGSTSRSSIGTIERGSLLGN